MKFSKLFDTHCARQAQKSLDYLDGNQLQYVIQQLDDPNIGRRNWRQKGIVPFYRNITAMIVQKSGLLLQNGAPIVEIKNEAAEVADPIQTQRMNDLLEEVYWEEFLANVDPVVRRLKTVWVLQQFDPYSNTILFDLLHAGNCVVETDPVARIPTKLTYRIDNDYDDGNNYYRVITMDKIQDWVEPNVPGATTDATLVSEVDNPYGLVPVTPWHDTNMPRCGIWNKQPSDLTILNDVVNMHLTDTQYAATWAIHQTLFTNCKIQSTAYGNVVTQQPTAQDPYGRQGSASVAGVVGGMGQIVEIDTQSVETPIIEYKGPELNLQPVEEVFSSWIRDFASDWSVRVKVAGEGTATSGFQLVVEEIDNIELRKQRMKMAEIAIERMLRLTMFIFNAHFPNSFSQAAEADIEFTLPALPFDEAAVEAKWSIMLTEQRATPVDYYQEVWGMTKDEAIQKDLEVKAYYRGLPAPVKTETETTEPADEVSKNNPALNVMQE